MEANTTGLAERLRVATWALHGEAERSGIVRDIIAGRVSRRGYVLYLRGLLPAYRMLEAKLVSHADEAGVRWVNNPSLFRSAAIAADLDQLAGPDWEDRHVPPAAAAVYAEAIAAAAAADARRLIGHAYTRYLGDLNGGAAMRRVLTRAVGLPRRAQAFFAYPAHTEPKALSATYRDAIDRAGSEIADADAVVDEARLAFRLNIQLSIAVHDATLPARSCRRTGDG